MEAPPGELQVVRQHQEEPEGDEQREPGLEGDRAHDADRAGAQNRNTGEPHEHPIGDLRAQRSPVQLVEGVRSDADGEGERGGGGTQPFPGADGCEPFPGDDGRQAAADDDIRQMPGRVLPPSAARSGGLTASAPR
jgi:hypothetical protein